MRPSSFVPFWILRCLCNLIIILSSSYFSAICDEKYSLLFTFQNLWFYKHFYYIDTFPFPKWLAWRNKLVLRTSEWNTQKVTVLQNEGDWLQSFKFIKSTENWTNFTRAHFLKTQTYLLSRLSQVSLLSTSVALSINLFNIAVI